MFFCYNAASRWVWLISRKYGLSEKQFILFYISLCQYASIYNNLTFTYEEHKLDLRKIILGMILILYIVFIIIVLLLCFLVFFKEKWHSLWQISTFQMKRKKFTSFGRTLMLFRLLWNCLKEGQSTVYLIFKRIDTFYIWNIFKVVDK